MRMRLCLIVGHDDLLREGFASVVRLGWPQADIDRVNNPSSIWAAVARQPDVALVDLDLFGGSRLAAIRRLRGAAPAMAIIAVSDRSPDGGASNLQPLFNAGLGAFLSPGCSRARTLAVVDLVLAGRRHRADHQAERTGSELDRESIAPRRASRPPLAPAVSLTPRQTDVLRLVAAGRSNKQIAAFLGLSPATVKVHVAAVISRMCAANRTEAAVLAFAGDLVGSDDPGPWLQEPEWNPRRRTPPHGSSTTHRPTLEQTAFTHVNVDNLL